MKNPFMSAWLSWANRATGMWTATAVSAAKRHQSAMTRAATAKPKAKRKPAKRREG